MTLISGCNSRWLQHFRGVIYDQSLRYRLLAFRAKDFPRDQSRRECKQILDAALARDVTTRVSSGRTSPRARTCIPSMRLWRRPGRGAAQGAAEEKHKRKNGRLTKI